MKETTWIIDASNGALTVEGLGQTDLSGLAGDLLPPGRSLNCARPIDVRPLGGSPDSIASDKPSLRVFRIYHGSVIEGPGRRSVVQTSGCNLRCPGCHAVETHSLESGVEMTIGKIVEMLLAPAGRPRDGITILGGEPFLQPAGLLALMRTLKGRGQHLTIYTGYTLEELIARRDERIIDVLALTDILIDGPFVKELAENAGQWRGSTNQRIVHRPLSHRPEQFSRPFQSGRNVYERQSTTASSEGGACLEDRDVGWSEFTRRRYER